MRIHQRQFNETRLPRSVVDPLYRFAVIPRLGPKDIRHKRLRISIVEREPARLHLNHHAVTREKDVVRRGQREAVQQRLVGFDRLAALHLAVLVSACDFDQEGIARASISETGASRPRQSLLDDQV